MSGNRWLIKALTLCVSAAAMLGACWAAEDAAPTAPRKNPSMLVFAGEGRNSANAGDFIFFQRLHQAGIDLDVYFYNEKDCPPVTWDLIKNYNCLVLLDLPLGKDRTGTNLVPKAPISREDFISLLDRYLAEGGGVFLMPWKKTYNSSDTQLRLENLKASLERWGAKVPWERILDPRTAVCHPRTRVPFIYTEAIFPSPVSEGVKGIWFPTRSDSMRFLICGQPIDVTGDWQVVVRGSDTSYTEIIDPAKFGGLGGDASAASAAAFTANMYFRPEPKKPPTLFAIRGVGEGRMALSLVLSVFHLQGGTTWIHDGALLDKGLNGTPSDFGKLFVNTVRWLSEPSLKSGKLGGYVQDPRQLVHPNLRKKPQEFFPEFASFQNPTPPGRVFKGLIGARTAYSGCQGTVEDYAKAAKEAGLDFIVFLEEFGKISEADYRKLDTQCKALSTNELLLIPGFTIDNNIGNHLFTYGYDAVWPKPEQLTGPNKDQLFLQSMKDGKLWYGSEPAFGGEVAKTWIWDTIQHKKYRNIGYYNFAAGAGMPFRDLRLLGFVAVMTYIDGKLVEDLTADYLDYVMDGDPPLAGAVEIMRSPEQVTRAVKDGHYLTHVAGSSLKDLPALMHYGSAYGRANVYPSNGPEIRSWAGTQRIMTYAGETFVPQRYRIRPLCWVTSEAGLKEIVIHCDRKPYRRLLFNGEKEFKQTFEWAFDRHRILTLEVTDVNGRRALSAGFEYWAEANYSYWCHDRQNGDLWHGPLVLPGPRMPEFNCGPTWDGGPAGYIGWSYEVHPALQTRDKEVEGTSKKVGGRWMEGNEYPTCYDDTTANYACVGDHVYASGVVAHGYFTLGPVTPSKNMTFSLRRTQYIQRGKGPSLGGWPDQAERVGGNLALFEGTMKLRRDLEAASIDVLSVETRVPANVPLIALRSGEKGLPFCGSQATFEQAGAAPRGLGLKGGLPYTLEPGGYLALLHNEMGNNCVVFNAGQAPLQLQPICNGAWWVFSVPLSDAKRKAEETFEWRYLVAMDAIDQTALNMHRIERIRSFYGLDGSNGSGIVVKTGKLLSHFGVVDIEPQKGVVEFEVPRPDWECDLPLGLRFIGFNPNWSIVLHQIEGYSQGFYTNGKDVYRSLALDDRGMAHLAVYPYPVEKTHCVAGHPVQCDAKDLIIEVAMLGSKPPLYHVAVNNPTDTAIKTTLRKCMALPRFEFQDTPVEVPAGGYVVVKKE